MRLNRRRLIMLFVLMMMVILPVGALADDCGCGVVQLEGAEKNKIVAEVLKNDDFKQLKKSSMAEGYVWNGVSEAQVVRTPGGDILIAIPVTSPAGESYAIVHALGVEGFYLIPASE